MRFRLSLEFVTGEDEGILVGDWVDDLKGADRKEADRLHEIRRHENRANELLDLKGKEFWREVLRCIENDVEKLSRRNRRGPLGMKKIHTALPSPDSSKFPEGTKFLLP